MRDSRRRVSVLAAGALLSQALVLWPSLFGGRVLLPLEVVAHPNLYLPATDARARLADMSISDAIVQYEPWRRFAASEFRAGRIPLWIPFGFAGAPFALWPKYSPFNLIYYARPAPTTLVFVHLAAALVATAGAYGFFRRCLRVGFWPAAVGAWAYPLTGHFALWLAFPVPSVTAWLPWLLWAAERSARRPRGRGPLALAVLGALVLVSGLTDWALLSLITAGLYAAWCAWRGHRRRLRAAAGAALACAAALVVSALLAAPYLLPMTQYVRSGARYATRLEGRQDRPPLGLRVLPQVVLPGVFGTTTPGDIYTVPGNRREGVPSAYAGLWMTLVLAPWALGRRPRIVLLPWVVLAILGVSATLGIPGLVQLFRLPFANLVSYNRFAFATGLALLCLAVTGLDQVARRVPSRAPLVVSLSLLAITGAWTAWYRSRIPQAITARLGDWPYSVNGFTPEQLAAVHASQRANTTEAAALVLCGLAMAVALGRGLGRRRGVRFALGVMAVGELAAFSAREVHHGDPALDYPPLPSLAALANDDGGRVLALGCLPPNMLATAGLRDVRGYDAVDPARYVELVLLSRDPEADRYSPYFARTLQLAPRHRFTADGAVDLPGVLDMLGVRHVILPPLPGDARGYRVARNADALPHAWVPESVKDVGDGAPVLARLGAPRFDPRRVAFAEGVVARNDVRGRASVVAERADRLDVDVEMETPGLLMVSTLWDEGWHAWTNGQPRPVLRANHALQGVPMDAGRARVVLAYDPPVFWRGVRLMLLGAAAWCAAALAAVRRHRLRGR